jgi:tRNA pseudouridine38-40 synthase
LEDNLYKLIIKGNGFLYNMVRIIMGTLVNIGLGKIEPKDVENIILCKDRSKSGKTMPAKGLVLKKVEY